MLSLNSPCELVSRTSSIEVPSIFGSCLCRIRNVNRVRTKRQNHRDDEQPHARTKKRTTNQRRACFEISASESTPKKSWREQVGAGGSLGLAVGESQVVGFTGLFRGLSVQNMHKTHRFP